VPELPNGSKRNSWQLHNNAVFQKKDLLNGAGIAKLKYINILQIGGSRQLQADGSMRSIVIIALPFTVHTFNNVLRIGGFTLIFNY